MAQAATLPKRLHHNAYVTKDQEKTRRFYEEVIGLPLIATWCESDELFGKVRTYVHTFYGIGDGGALAFFQFADPEFRKTIRTTNAIERRFREVRRRTRPMGVFSDRTSVERILYAVLMYENINQGAYPVFGLTQND